MPATLKRLLERLGLASPYGFVSDLARELELQAEPAGPVFPGVRFAGDRAGRHVSLAFAREVEDTRVTEVARLVLALSPGDGFVARLELRRADARDTLARLLGMERTRSLGPLRVSAVFAPAVERLLRSRFAALAIRAFERFALRTLVLEPRELRVTLPSTLEPGDYAALLALLEDVARAVEELALRVTVTAESGSGRCAYCHDDGPEVPCASCGASLHGSCWDDHGRCPVFGCGGHPDPARGWIPVGTVRPIVARVDASPEGA